MSDYTCANRNQLRRMKWIFYSHFPCVSRRVHYDFLCIPVHSGLFGLQCVFLFNLLLVHFFNSPIRALFPLESKFFAPCPLQYWILMAVDCDWTRKNMWPSMIGGNRSCYCFQLTISAHTEFKTKFGNFWAIFGIVTLRLPLWISASYGRCRSEFCNKSWKFVSYFRKSQGPSWPRILGSSDFSLQEN